MTKQNRLIVRVFLLFVLVAALAITEGCYYLQAIGGQMEVLRKRRPLNEVIGDDTTPVELRDRLRMVQEAREFAVEVLLLPQNKSYRSYTDLERDFVLWNVFAAPEFSLEPETWCFPVAGCVAYRGYFKETKAREFAAKLHAKGFDVNVGGVPAYSTLGRFNDPVLNTMMRWSDAYLVETLFHELAHQKLYVKGDTAFNESFASTVAAIGIERWSKRREISDDVEKRRLFAELQAEIANLVEVTRGKLQTVYDSNLSDHEKRNGKRLILDKLSAAAQALVTESGLSVNNWLAPPLNNARLISQNLYDGSRPAFDRLAANCNDDMACFYAQAAALAELSFDERQARLAKLAN